MSFLPGWDDWQLDVLDDYILGYSEFETQEELANYIGKSLNALKVRLSRRRKEIEFERERELTREEYIMFLSNRFKYMTEELAILINIPYKFLLYKLDEIDNLECKEFLQENFENREFTNDEYEVFIKLLNKGRNAFQISQILNRNIKLIERLIREYESI